MYERVESEYFTAKRKAARRVCRQWIKPNDLPSNAEVRDLVQSFARLHEGERRTADLRDMRLAALKMMRLLCQFKPRLIGSVMTGHVRRGSDIDLHLFSDSLGLVTGALENEGHQFDVEHKRVVKHNEARIFTHVHVYDRFDFELTVYAENLAHYVFRSSITGKPIERASVRELEQIVRRDHPDADPDAEDEPEIDPFPVYRILLLPLDAVRQSPKWHPEGDALYHSLQVFELARLHRPYDEEFLTAALLHDVGKGLDPADHVTAGLHALDGLITDRTAFFIRHHMDAQALNNGTLGARARRRLQQSPDFEDLMLLRECDDGGRVPGAQVGSADDALGYLRELQRMNRE